MKAQRPSIRVQMKFRNLPPNRARQTGAATGTGHEARSGTSTTAATITITITTTTTTATAHEQPCEGEIHQAGPEMFQCKKKILSFD